LLRRDDPSVAPWEEGAKKYPCIMHKVNQDETPAKKMLLEKYQPDEVLF